MGGYDFAFNQFHTENLDNLLCSVHFVANGIKMRLVYAQALWFGLLLVPNHKTREDPSHNVALQNQTIPSLLLIRGWKEQAPSWGQSVVATQVKTV